MAKYETITCEECTAEYDIKVLNEDELNYSDIKFCPCCGKRREKTIVEDDEFESGFSEWDDQDNNSF